MKSKESGIRRTFMMKNSNILTSKYESYGAEDIDIWLTRNRALVKTILQENPNITKSEFLTLCEEEGMIISYPEDFLKVYWKKK
jgi:hypothetical protein